ncbi:MAG: helix-turn-helix transcriptional regulator [Micropepsaceae bacterium]
MITPATPTDIFQKRLRQARDLRGHSQAELGALAGMPASSVAHFEAGNRKPSFDTLRRLANALNVTTDYLIGRADDPSHADVGDTLYRDVGKLTGRDRELAEEFVQMLAKRNKQGDSES